MRRQTMVGHPHAFLQVVVSILDTANSSYLAPFNVLSQRIKEGSVEANNNLKFLESITTPCQNVRIRFYSLFFLPRVKRKKTAVSI